MVFAGLVVVTPLLAQNGGRPAPVESSAALTFLEPGDKIGVRLWQDPQLSGEFVVDESGYVSLPLLGLRQVTRRPAGEVKRQLMDEFGRQLRNQTAQITMLHRVRVLGAVGEPGLYFADGTMTLADVVAEAGGVAPDGDQNDVRIERAGKVYRTRLDRGLGEIPIQSGDVVIVEQRSWLARNAGVVIGAFISAVTIVVTRR